jgi:putative phosphoribosyl transferase
VAHDDRGGRAGRSEDRPHPAAQEAVRITVGGVALDGDLARPPGTGGIVVFAHGSGSSRHSPRNRRVAEHLQRAELGTLLLDLLTADEEQLDLRSRELRFDIGLLARRLVGAIDWLTARFGGGQLRVGLFGASTGAAAALVAAAERPSRVGGVVSRGGRPDLAGRALERVLAPTLLIVGGADTQVLTLNRQAAGRLAAPHRLEVVPGAGHLFEEPGALEEVARQAAAWFAAHLRQISPDPSVG